MNNEADREHPLYFTLHPHVARELGISWPEYILLDTIYTLSGKYGYCYKTISSLSEDMLMSFNGTKKLINRLLERELLVKERNGWRCADAFSDVAKLSKTGRIAKTAQSAKTVDKTAQSAIFLTKTSSDENKVLKKYAKLHKVATIALCSDKNINTSINNTSISTSNINITSTSKTKNSEALRLIDYWNKTFNTNIRPISGRLNKIRVRLKTYQAEEVARAIYNASQDPFFLGDGPRGWVGTIDYLIRSDENIEKYLYITPVKQVKYA